MFININSSCVYVGGGGVLTVVINDYFIDQDQVPASCFVT